MSTILVECKMLMSPYMLGTGFGELLVQHELLITKKLEIEKKLEEKLKKKISVREPIEPYLSFCDFKVEEGEQLKWMTWSESYTEFFNRLKDEFKTFNVGLMLAKRRIAKPVISLKSEDLFVEIIYPAK